MSLESPILTAHRAKAIALRKQLETVEAELRGMEMVLASIDVSARHLSGHSAPASTREADGAAASPIFSARKSSKGRQAGAISKPWRDTLSLLYATHEWFSDEEAVPMARFAQGREVRRVDVRRILDGYVEHGYIEVADGRYRVTEQAAKRYGFVRAIAADNVIIEAEGPRLTGVPSAPLPYPSQEGGGAFATIPN